MVQLLGEGNLVMKANARSCWLALVVAVGMAPLSRQATADTWTNSAGDRNWFNHANWADNSVPTSSDDAIIQLVGANRAEIGVGTAYANKVIVADSAGSVGELAMFAGATTYFDEIRIANNPNTTGTMTIDEGSANLISSFLVGVKGNGTLRQNGGTIFAQKMVVGVDRPNPGQTAAAGLYEMHGGTLDVVENVGISFGAGTTGTFNQTGGTIFARQMLLGDQGPIPILGLPASHGTANISGGKIDLIQFFRVGNGNNSKGTLNFSGGEIIAVKALLGDQNRGSGHVTMSGTAKFDLVEDLYMTGDGSSTFNMSGGTILTNHIVVGGHGKVVMTMSGGLIDATASLLLADSPTGEGYLTMTGGTIDLNGNIVLGWGDVTQPDGGIAAKLTVDGPDAVINANNIFIRDELHLGQNAFEIELLNGMVNLQGWLADFMVLGSPQFGLFDMHGGTLTLAGDKVAHVEARILSGDLTANGAAMSMLSDFSIVYDGTKTIVTLAAAGVAGDYNSDGIVDAADYVVWRKAAALGTSSLPNRSTGLSGPVGQMDYDFWRSRFGATAGSGTDIRASNAVVPEPATRLILSLTCLLLGVVSTRIR